MGNKCRGSGSPHPHQPLDLMGQEHIHLNGYQTHLLQYSTRKEPISVLYLSLITLLMESRGNPTSRANTRGCGLQVWTLSCLTCMHLQGLNNTALRSYVLKHLFNISAPSMSYSCYGDISALQAPTISCTPVRASDCGMYHSLLELSTFVLDREMPYLLLLPN